ncbi:MAG: hypothetical protein ABIU84_15165 [Thermoanaerobaculia bacterium]
MEILLDIGANYPAGAKFPRVGCPDPITVLVVVDRLSAATAGSDYTLDIAFN